MSKGRYDKFLNAYAELDNICAEYLGVEREGVAEYINRLGSCGGGARRAHMLSNLVRYRAVKNELERADGASKKSTVKIKSNDITRINAFIREISKRRDPLSLDLRRKERSKKPLPSKILFISLFACLALLICAITVALCFLLINQ